MPTSVTNVTGLEVKILTKTGNAPDHPVSVYHPEGEYSKGLLLQVN